MDTNGAGDSFFAGLLYAQAAGYPIAPSLRIATTVAAMTVASAALISATLSPQRVRQSFQERFGGAQ